ncbi:hypothetical protein NDU88_005946 [Pleurodeles waltl]|uniref:Uncharacterized protein n=1 Tax=Pleurodeles waltl TaxID=8319 RepID=A0AAV7QJR0_PLEWA|nr:hypothetical protein NDU88_005946 [Pleurodeles waltl]
MDVPRREELCRTVFPQKDRKQALLAAKLAVRVFGCCCGPGGTRMSPIASGDRGGAQHDKEPSQKQAAPAEVLEQALRSGVKRLHKRVPRRRRTTQEVVQCRLECRGPRLGCAQRKSSWSAQEPE